MSKESIANVALLVTMVAVGAGAWWLQLRPALDFDARALEGLPLRVGAWQGHSVPLEYGVERMLRADLNLQREYESDTSPEVVWMYVGYYGTERGGRPEHTPEVCYPSAGWDIVRHEEQQFGDGHRVNEFIVERAGNQRLVHFWYHSSRGAGLLDNLDVSVDHLKGRLSDGRADGALVRLSTPITDAGIEASRERLTAFYTDLVPEIGSRWPSEAPKRS
ncbi:MAG: exosortase C-terminal domain/associated protein EpsI [Myxococcota bacterium]